MAQTWGSSQFVPEAVCCPCPPRLCLSFSQKFVFELLAGNTLRAEVRAEKAGKVDENHDVQHEQDTQQKGAQGPLAPITQEKMSEVGLRGQAEKKVHDQVDILVDLVKEEMLGIVDLHHHADGEEDVADLYQQCQDTPTNKPAPKDA